ncbi:MAG TPA: AraC family transcriptional regulator [Burkholderiaceae bacterium]|nr:AraC family transcriptional regulator [Burkholderiaceae bacterium]
MRAVDTVAASDVRPAPPVLLMRDLPDIDPRPLTPGNAPFRRWFYANWGRSTALIRARPRSADLFAHAHPLSIKMAWNGSVFFSLPNRRLRVDDDSYLIFNEGTHYGTAFRSERVMDCFCVFFRNGLAQELSGARHATLAQAAASGPNLPRRSVDFAEHLRPHDTAVTPHLRALARAIDDGVDDLPWYEERVQALLLAMLAAEPAQRERATCIKSVKASTREELTRRVLLATDFLLSNYTEPLALDDLAHAAHLSKFHLVRLFKQVHGTSPHAYLQAKRARVARRLIEATDHELNDIAARAGFGSRWTMFRQLRKQFRMSGLDLRRAS